MRSSSVGDCNVYESQDADNHQDSRERSSVVPEVTPTRSGAHATHPEVLSRIKGTQMAQMTQILTCSVWGFRRFREILLMTCRILCFIFGGFKKMRNFASIVKRLNYRRIDYGCLCCKPTL